MLCRTIPLGPLPVGGARAIVGTTLVLVLAVAGYGVYAGFRHVTAAAPPAPGCQAGTGEQAITLDTEQAAIAATIAGVAARHRLPRQAVTIALAAALQESKLHNLDYGDRDSVGIFQQRPSEGWGPASRARGPRLRHDQVLRRPHPGARLRHDARLPGGAGRAAQRGRLRLRAVDQLAGQLAGYFTGQSPHGVSCWYTPAGQANLAGAVRRMAQTFGPPGQKAVVARITTVRSGQKNTGSTAVLHVQRAAAWTVANWLVAHAQAYGLSEVRYAGYEWKAADGSMGWQRGPRPVTGTSAATRQYCRRLRRHVRRPAIL